ncbi:MAG: YbaK/EbsC family protein [Anaerolineales bacterium]|jgi:prolyl-tRNA editing enzyme YbaK/EbsC (Cys-tRNA(Pro) deacylase)
MLTPDDLTAFIESNKVDAQVIVLPVATPTVEAAAQAVGTSASQIVKSLLFLVDGKPALAVACGEGRVDRRPIARHFDVGRKRVKMADADAVLKFTGYPIGAVPPFGMPQQPETLIDVRLFEHDVVYAGGGDVNALIKVHPGEIERITHGIRLDLLNPDALK